jgi:hypothetical protein
MSFKKTNNGENCHFGLKKIKNKKIPQFVVELLVI